VGDLDKDKFAGELIKYFVGIWGSHSGEY
jgi:hypothetical protein